LSNFTLSIGICCHICICVLRQIWKRDLHVLRKSKEKVQSKTQTPWPSFVTNKCSIAYCCSTFWWFVALFIMSQEPGQYAERDETKHANSGSFPSNEQKTLKRSKIKVDQTCLLIWRGQDKNTAGYRCIPCMTSWKKNLEVSPDSGTFPCHISLIEMSVICFTLF
jgi:hypothetical protein